MLQIFSLAICCALNLWENFARDGFSSSTGRCDRQLGQVRVPERAGRNGAFNSVPHLGFIRHRFAAL